MHRASGRSVAFNRNQSRLTVARATGAVMVVAVEAGIDIEEQPDGGEERRHRHGQR